MAKRKKPKNQKAKTTRRKLKPYPICHGKKERRTIEISKYSNFKEKKISSKK